jgi:hypothetical protein
MKTLYFKSHGIKNKKGQRSTRFYRYYRTLKARTFYDSFCVHPNNVEFSKSSSELNWLEKGASWKFPIKKEEYQRAFKAALKHSKNLTKRFV